MADASYSPPEEQVRIESALIDVVTFQGEEDQRRSLAGRQAERLIPLTSIAVARDGKLHWAKAYGAGGDTNTRLQAASLSKTIAAVGLLSFAEDRGVYIDDDISDQINLLEIDSLNPNNLPITLRGLLSHTNGTTISGFRGYAIGSDLPTSREIVAGLEPANSEPVIVKANPKVERRYSGGGYQVAQLWAETLSGEPFEQLLQQYVLRPVGMSNSSFTIVHPGDDEMAKEFSKAHDYDGSVMGGGWFLHPEQAAAGLWITPEDYLNFLIALMSALDGDNRGAVRPSVAQEIVRPVIGENGLGLGV